MIIALNYDGTYTKDIAFWDAFIANAAVAGHRVVCVTQRGDKFPIKVPCEVLYTNGCAKKDAAIDAGIYVNWWIDDNPRSVFEDAFQDEQVLRVMKL